MPAIGQQMTIAMYTPKAPIIAKMRPSGGIFMNSVANEATKKGIRNADQKQARHNHAQARSGVGARQARTAHAVNVISNHALNHSEDSSLSGATVRTPRMKPDRIAAWLPARTSAKRREYIFPPPKRAIRARIWGLYSKMRYTKSRNPLPVH